MKRFNMKYINHGLGIMLQTEHDYLVKEKAISCDGEVDMILCDYPKLKVEDKTTDYGGNIDLIKQEIQQLSLKGKNATTTYTPKKYTTYLANKKRTWRDDEAERPLPTEDGVAFEDVLNIIP